MNAPNLMLAFQRYSTYLQSVSGCCKRESQFSSQMILAHGLYFRKGDLVTRVPYKLAGGGWMARNGCSPLKVNTVFSNSII